MSWDVEQCDVTDQHEVGGTMYYCQRPKGHNRQHRFSCGHRFIDGRVASAEEWRPFVGCWGEGHYSVSALGNVRREPSRRLMHPVHAGMGKYLMVRTSVDDVARNVRLATIVALAFLGPKPSPTHEVNHKDGNTENNAATNLEWVTKRQQEDHAVANALHAWGERHGMAKLTADIVRLIRISAESNRTLASRYGVGIAAIRNARSGETWKHLDTEFDRSRDIR